MNDYPLTNISAGEYSPDINDGAIMSRSEDGSPRIQRLFAVDQYTFEITHFALSTAEALDLKNFYAANKNSQCRYVEPDTGNEYRVLMTKPPQPISRVGSNVTYRMTLAGEPY